MHCYALSPLVIVLDDALLPAVQALRTRALARIDHAPCPALSAGHAGNRRSMARFRRSLCARAGQIRLTVRRLSSHGGSQSEAETLSGYPLL